MKKLLVVIAIPLLAFAAILLFHKSSNQVQKEKKVSIKESLIAPDNTQLVRKSINDVDALIEIPNKSEAKVFQIKDLKVIQSKSNIFKKAYKEDLVVLLPDRTIIYDPITKTVRDVSKVKFYDEFSE